MCLETFDSCWKMQGKSSRSVCFSQNPVWSLDVLLTFLMFLILLMFLIYLIQNTHKTLLHALISPRKNRDMQAEEKLGSNSLEIHTMKYVLHSI